MAASRALPAQRNPLIAPQNSPSIEILVERRRLGQTKLNMKPPTVGIKDAERMGTFDYAHLRVPLPKDLTGSEIFTLKALSAYPESYFLMRRSSDGYISATGMFKAAFPWASLAEEEAERAYHKSFESAGGEEVAGSVWLAPEEALALSEQYGMRLWIDALLDPAPIEKGNKDKHTTHIAMPPKFDPSKVPSASFSGHTPNLRASTRSRSTRSASPSKMATPSRKIATPRKSRRKAPEVVQSEEMETIETASVSSALRNVVENGTVSESVASEPVNGEVKEQHVHIEVQQAVEQEGDVETKITNVKVDVPADHPELQEPEDPAELIKQARAMVEEANKLDGIESSEKASKRKAEELSEDEVEQRPQRPAKLARTNSTLEQRLAKEKVTRRALVGVAVMTAITTAVSYFAGFAA